MNAIRTVTARLAVIAALTAALASFAALPASADDTEPQGGWVGSAETDSKDEAAGEGEADGEDAPRPNSYSSWAG